MHNSTRITDLVRRTTRNNDEMVGGEEAGGCVEEHCVLVAFSLHEVNGWLVWYGGQNAGAFIRKGQDLVRNRLANNTVRA